MPLGHCELRHYGPGAQNVDVAAELLHLHLLHRGTNLMRVFVFLCLFACLFVLFFVFCFCSCLLFLLCFWLFFSFLVGVAVPPPCRLLLPVLLALFLVPFCLVHLSADWPGAQAPFLVVCCFPSSLALVSGCPGVCYDVQVSPHPLPSLPF